MRQVNVRRAATLHTGMTFPLHRWSGIAYAGCGRVPDEGERGALRNIALTTELGR